MRFIKDNNIWLKVIILVCLYGCKLEKDENIDAGTVNEEIRNRKPIRITAGEVLSVCNQYGEIFSAYYAADSDYCGIVGQTPNRLPDSLAYLCKDIRVVCTQEMAVYEKEKMLFLSYREAYNQGIHAGGSLQSINDSTTLYTYGVKGGMITFELNRREIAKMIYRKKTEPKNWFKKKD